MPSYQPKVSTKHKDYPCRVCNRTAKELGGGASDLYYDGIDEANAAITASALTKPICRHCVCEQNPTHYICWPRGKNIIGGEECCWRCGMGRKSQEIQDGMKCSVWGKTYKTHIWTI